MSTPGTCEICWELYEGSFENHEQTSEYHQHQYYVTYDYMWKHPSCMRAGLALQLRDKWRHPITQGITKWELDQHYSPQELKDAAKTLKISSKIRSGRATRLAKAIFEQVNAGLELSQLTDIPAERSRIRPRFLHVLKTRPQKPNEAKVDWEENGAESTIPIPSRLAMEKPAGTKEKPPSPPKPAPKKRVRWETEEKEEAVDSSTSPSRSRSVDSESSSDSDSDSSNSSSSSSISDQPARPAPVVPKVSEVATSFRVPLTQTMMEWITRSPPSTITSTTTLCEFILSKIYESNKGTVLPDRSTCRSILIANERYLAVEKWFQEQEKEQKKERTAIVGIDIPLVQLPPKSEAKRVPPSRASFLASPPSLPEVIPTLFAKSEDSVFLYTYEAVAGKHNTTGITLQMWAECLHKLSILVPQETCERIFRYTCNNGADVITLEQWKKFAISCPELFREMYDGLRENNKIRSAEANMDLIILRKSEIEDDLKFYEAEMLRCQRELKDLERSMGGVKQQVLEAQSSFQIWKMSQRGNIIAELESLNQRILRDY